MTGISELESIPGTTDPIPGEQALLPVPETADSGVGRATAVNALGNITSRILGLARESLLANQFGANAAMDAFRIAIIVPRGLYDLLIGGHVNSALVPVLSAYAEREDRDDLWGLMSALMNLAALLMSGLVLSITLLAPYIIRLVASGESDPEIIQEATRLLQITAPALFFMSLFAVLSSLLYALRRFTWPAFAATIFNLSVVVVTVGLAPHIGITAAALGWLLGSAMQLILQWAGLRGVNLRYHWRLWHPGIRTIGLLYLPVMFSLALDVLVNRPFSYNLASRTGAGAISTMDYATTLVQFPHGLVATAISIAVLPTLARQANENDLSAFKTTLGEGLRLALALIIPATVGLLVLAIPIVGLIFQHGAFTSEDTAMTALALRLYMLGLPFASIDLLLVFAFYARQDTLTPALIGLLSLVAYMITAILLLPYYSFYSLMLADSVKHLIHASVSAYLLMPRIGGLGGQGVLKTAFKATFAACIMGGVAMGILAFLAPIFDAHTLIHEAVLVIGAGGTSGLLYLFLAHRLGIAEIQMIFKQIKQRL